MFSDRELVRRLENKINQKLGEGEINFSDNVDISKRTFVIDLTLSLLNYGPICFLKQKKSTIMTTGIMLSWYSNYKLMSLHPMIQICIDGAAIFFHPGV